MGGQVWRRDRGWSKPAKQLECILTAMLTGAVRSVCQPVLANGLFVPSLFWQMTCLSRVCLGKWLSFIDYLLLIPQNMLAVAQVFFMLPRFYLDDCRNLPDGLDKVPPPLTHTPHYLQH